MSDGIEYIKKVKEGYGRAWPNKLSSGKELRDQQIENGQNFFLLRTSILILLAEAQHKIPGSTLACRLQMLPTTIHFRVWREQ